ncbi:hypothetical protein MVEN_02585300 [Mycena venus]|uniref:GmrSD restriction endonucleases C-terminal domain-containing protein n=1 Tax=Mycena venus TaxID=2733690 RepID=A0A8H6U1I2_9AGAR|nr:hypothetical protein MVEN_02585300 [Mycena venus]
MVDQCSILLCPPSTLLLNESAWSSTIASARRGFELKWHANSSQYSVCQSRWLPSARLLSLVSFRPFSLPPSPRALPTPVSVATAKTYLSELTVAVDSNTPAYSRDQFKTWDTISGTCDTRETVLKRDGTNVVTNSACAATSGNWVSPYDGVATTLASDLDIDHLVPLKEAWISGARDWTAAQREAFANDLTRPQLVAVTDNLNESKGASFILFICPSDAGSNVTGFVPPLASYVCTYIRAWITVKHFYDLTIDSAEKTALTKYINAC